MATDKLNMNYEVHPSPQKDEKGKYQMYVRPQRGRKLSMKQMDGYCTEHSTLLDGELTRALEIFARQASQLLAQGYRIETPIGSFAPKLGLKRKYYDADEVKDEDVTLTGIDYIPVKEWEDKIADWLCGFNRFENPNVQKNMADKDQLEQIMRACIAEFGGYTTARIFSVRASLTYYSARRQLDDWCKGENPKLLRTMRGQEYIYTEI